MVRAVRKGNPIEDEEHVVRHVPYGRLARCGDDDTAVGILATALVVRPKDNNQLSVNWLEYHDGSHHERLTATVRDYRAARKADGITVGPQSGFAVARVGTIKQIGRDNDRKLRVVCYPSKGNQSHSLLMPLQAEETTLLEILATEAFTDLVISKDIPP